MTANLIDRFLGRVASVAGALDSDVIPLTATPFAAGDVVNSGGVMASIPCASVNRGDVLTLTGFSVWEYAATGTRAKAALAVDIFDTSTPLPAQNNPLVLATGAYLNHIGRVTVDTADYTEYTDGTNNLAVAHVTFDPAKVMRVGTATRALYYAVTTTGTPTFDASATLRFRPHWGQ